MINPLAINPLSLPCVSVEDRKRLPKTPSIYFAIDAQNQIQYIGRSINPRQRWANHHRFGEVQNCRISYFECDAILLSEIELALIDYFNPPLNRLPFGRRSVDSYSHNPGSPAQKANGRMVIRETVTTDYPAEGVGAAIKQAQHERREYVTRQSGQ
ncbi:MAG: GIY-YIG nuclease family protein [Microcoleus sp.]